MNNTEFYEPHDEDPRGEAGAAAFIILVILMLTVCCFG